MKRTSTTIILLLIVAATATLLAAERSTIQYKGMSVRDPAPYGEAGLAWQNNFKSLADRIGPCKFDATTPPTATDDSTAGYATGSLWYDTTANRLYWCASAADGAAVWIEVSPADLSQVYQPLDADLTTWSGVASSADGRAIVSAADYAAMRGLLGLGTMATQGAGSVAITGGSITGITDLAVADGGTGASDAAGARSNLGFTAPILNRAAPGDIGATTPGAGTFTTLQTTRELGVQGTPAGGYAVTLRQLADSQALVIYGYDDRATSYGALDVDADGAAVLRCNHGMKLTSSKGFALTAGDGVVSITAVGTDKYMNIYSAASYSRLGSGPEQDLYLDAGKLFTFRDRDASYANRLTINSATGELSIPSDTAGLKLDAAGTTTLVSNGTVATLSKPLKAAGYQAADGSAGISQTIAIKDADAKTHTLVFKDGLLTSYTTNP